MQCHRATSVNQRHQQNRLQAEEPQPRRRGEAEASVKSQGTAQGVGAANWSLQSSAPNALLGSPASPRAT